MKKRTIILNIAALVLMGTMSCNKIENIPSLEEDKVVPIKITLNFDESPQTRGLTPSGVKTFKTGDQIAVIYQQDWKGFSKRVISEPLDAIYDNSKSATFTVNLPADSYYKPKAGGIVRFIYPAAMAKTSPGDPINDDNTINYSALSAQDGTLETLASKFDLTVFEGTAPAFGELPTSGTLENKLAICAYTLKNSDGSNEITNEITTMVINDGTYNYNVGRSSFSGPIYVAIRPIASANIKISATTGFDIYTKSLTDKTYEVGNGYNISLRMTKEEVVHGGFFTINSGGKMVYFAPGNLQAKYTKSSSTWSWQFAAHQYDCIGNGGGNKLITTSTKEASEPYALLSDDGTVDLFGFSTASTYFGIAKSTTNDDYSGDFVDWGTLSIKKTSSPDTYYPVNYWRTMTCDNSLSYEWHYVFMGRVTGATVNGTANARFTLAKVNGVNGIILFPDNYNGPKESQTGITWGTKINSNNGVTDWGGTTITSDGWAILESAGCVFLPAGLRRDGTTMGGDSFYASKTKKSDVLWYPMSFLSGSGYNVYWNMSYGLHYGASVRLVHQIN